MKKKIKLLIIQIFFLTNSNTLISAGINNIKNVTPSWRTTYEIWRKIYNLPISKDQKIIGLKKQISEQYRKLVHEEVDYLLKSMLSIYSVACCFPMVFILTIYFSYKIEYCINYLINEYERSKKISESNKQLNIISDVRVADDTDPHNKLPPGIPKIIRDYVIDENEIHNMHNQIKERNFKKMSQGLNIFMRDLRFNNYLPLKVSLTLFIFGVFAQRLINNSKNKNYKKYNELYSQALKMLEQVKKLYN